MTAAEIRDPTEGTGTGAYTMAIGPRRHRTARYLVADAVEVETGTTSEATVSKGAMVKTPPPPPTKTGRKLGAADIPVAKEVGRRDWGMGENT